MAGDLGVARGTVIINTTPAIAALSSLRTASAASVGALNQVGRASMNAGLGFLGLGAVIVAGFAAAVTKTAQLEKRLSYIQGITGLTTKEMEGLRQKTIELGQSSAYTALEVADGFTELSKAGATAAQITGGMGDAMITLGQSSDISLDKAATSLVSISSTFNLAAKDASHVADILQGAANASIISVEDMTVSFKYAGGVAANLGVSLEDTATSIAILGNAGIRGSTAGTSLRRIFLQLTPRTEKAAAAMKELGIITEDGKNKFYDATGKAKKMAEITEILRTSTKKLTPEMRQKAFATIFGDRAINSAIALAKGGATAFDKMGKAIGNVKAAEVAAERLNNLAGAWEILKGSVDSALISVGTPAQEPLKNLVQWITKLVNAFTNLSPGTQKFIVKVLLLVAALSIAAGSMLLFFGMFLRAIAIMKELAIVLNIVKFNVMAFMAVLKAGGIAAFLNPVGLIIIAVVALIAVFVLFFKKAYQGSAPLRKALSDMGDTLRKNLAPAIAWVKGVWQGLQDLWASFVSGSGNTLANWVVVFTDVLLGMIDGFNGIKSSQGGIVGFFNTVTTALRNAYIFIVDTFNVIRGAFMTGFNGIESSAAGPIAFWVNLGTIMLAAKEKFVQVIGIIKEAFDRFLFGFSQGGPIGPVAFFENVGRAVENFRANVVEKAKALFQAFLDAYNGFMSGISGDGGLVLTGIAGAFQTLGGILNNTVLPMFQAIWDTLANQVWPAIQQAWTAITSQLGPAFAEIGLLIQTQVWPALQQLWTALQTLWTAIQPILKILGILALVIIGVVVVAFVAILWVIAKLLPAIIGLGVSIFTMVMNVVMPVINVLVAIFTGAIQIITGIIKVFMALFQGDWGLMWEGIKSIARGAWTIIAGVFSGAWNIIKAIVVGMVKGIIQFFKDLYNSLVGNSIIPDMINGIIAWFAKLPGRVFTWIMDLISRVISGFTSLASQGRAKISAFISAVVGFFAGLPGRLLGALSKLVSTVVQKFISFATTAKAKVTGFISEVVGLFAGLPGKVASTLSALVSKVLSFGGGLLSAGKSLGSKIKEGIMGAITGLGDLVGGAVSKAVDRVQGFAGTAFAKAKSVGSGLWEGFKSGMGINSPSYIEKAMFQVTQVSREELNKLIQTVKNTNAQAKKLPKLPKNATPAQKAKDVGLRQKLVTLTKHQQFMVRMMQMQVAKASQREALSKAAVRVQSLQKINDRFVAPRQQSTQLSTASLRALIDAERASANAPTPKSDPVPLIGGDLVLQAAEKQSVDSQFDSVMFRLRTMRGIG